MTMTMMTALIHRRRLAGTQRLLLGLGLLLAFGAHAQVLAPVLAPVPPQSGVDAALLAKGKSLAIAADCAACHTDTINHGQAFAGGYPIASPVGTIYSTNITPSRDAGIGAYSEAEFARAIREGVRRDGARLYPAMPYTSYALLTDEDVHALYAYFMHGVAPVDRTAPPADRLAHPNALTGKPVNDAGRPVAPLNQVTKLPFPFDLRASMIGWNLLFLPRERFHPNPDHSAQVNRGDYLVNALAHCDACHTPRNAMMGEDHGQAFAGAMVGSWYAPNISADPVSGIGGWSNDELVQYLKTGRAPGKAQAGGSMAEAVEHSLQYLPESDLQAIAAYLKTTKPMRDPADSRAAHTYGAAISAEPQLRGLSGYNNTQPLTDGAQLYSGFCASCHQPDGAGSANQAYPSLFHNTATGLANPANLVSAILFGVDRTVDGQQVLMPRFDGQSYVQSLSDAQIATLANYVLKHYGNDASTVSAADVAFARIGGKPPLLAKLQPYIVPLLVLGIAALLVLFVVLRRRRARRRARRS
jgi:mono/diheme cytochrome c family protein